MGWVFGCQPCRYRQVVNTARCIRTRPVGPRRKVPLSKTFDTDPRMVLSKAVVPLPRAALQGAPFFCQCQRAALNPHLLQKDPMEQFMTPEFWVAVGQIVMIDILLGGDNAVVIALACRKLPPAQRTRGILWGTAGAIILRVVLIYFALTLLAIPFLKLAGAVLLVWIGIKLLAPDPDDDHGNINASDKLLAAIKTIIVADLVMSIDNVIAIAGAAQGAADHHEMPLVIFGLVISIPIIVWGSQLVIKLMDRFPLIITIGGMLLGWIAGTMAVSDPAVAVANTLPWMLKIDQANGWIKYGAGIFGALLVLALGKWMAARYAASKAERQDASPV